MFAAVLRKHSILALAEEEHAGGTVDQVCMMVYDMTDAAFAKKQLLALQVEQSEMTHAAT